MLYVVSKRIILLHFIPQRFRLYVADVASAHRANVFAGELRPSPSLNSMEEKLRFDSPALYGSYPEIMRTCARVLHTTAV